MDGGRWERLGLQALASLPLWVAGALVAVFARDLAEVAAAVVAGAGLISFAGLVALLALARRVRLSGERHRQVVTQSLALVDCMKDMHRRVTEMETARDAHVLPETALAIAADLELPAAGNDPETKDATPCDMPVDLTCAHVHRLADDTLVAKSLRRSGELVGNANELCCLLAVAAREPVDIAVEFAAPLALLRQTEGVKALEHALAGGGPALLLLVSQADLRAATRDEARALTRLTRLGLRLALTGLDGIDAAPEALCACAVVHVHVTRSHLLDVARADPQRLMRWSEALARQGIRLVADGVLDRRDAALLAALGASFGTRSAQGAHRPASGPDERLRPAMPWRAARTPVERVAI